MPLRRIWNILPSGNTLRESDSIVQPEDIMNAVTLLTAGWLLLAMCTGGDSWCSEDETSSYQPEVTVIDSGVKGPTVLIVAGIHGNETAGIAAAQRIAGWQILRGRLVVIAEANRAAIAAQKRLIPGVDEQQADLNRNFHVDKSECHPVGDIAAGLWRAVNEQSPNWLIDLHESINFRRINPETVGNTIIVCPNKDTLPLVKKLLQEVNNTITDESKKFLMLEWPAKGSLTRAAAQILKANAMIIETTRREPFDTRVEQHCLLVRKLLSELGMLEMPQK